MTVFVKQGLGFSLWVVMGFQLWQDVHVNSGCKEGWKQYARMGSVCTIAG